MRFLFKRAVVQACIFACIAFALGACIESEKPVFPPDTRALPFLPPLKADVYEPSEGESWKKKSQVTFTADRNLVVSAASGNRGDKETQYTFHPLGEGLFVVQAHEVGKKIFVYNVLEMRGGEGKLLAFDCKGVKADFAALGGVIEDGKCKLDKTKNPGALLLALSKKVKQPLQKYVPTK
jgi:hypothetical protein